MPNKIDEFKKKMAWALNTLLGMVHQYNNYLYAFKDEIKEISDIYEEYFGGMPEDGIDGKCVICGNLTKDLTKEVYICPKHLWRLKNAIPYR